MKRVILGLAALALVACGGGNTTPDDGFDGEETAGGEEAACRLSETPIGHYRLPVLPGGYDLLEEQHRGPWDQVEAVLSQTGPTHPEEADDEAMQAFYDGPFTEYLRTHRAALVEAETSLNALADETPDVRAVASTLVGLMYYHLAVEMLAAPLPPRVTSDPQLTATYLNAMEHSVQPVLDTVTDRAEYCVYVSSSQPDLHRWRVYCYALIGHAVMQAHHVHSMILDAEHEAESPEYIVRRWGAPRPGSSLGAHAQVEGNITSQDVAHYVTSHQTPLLACYHRSLDEDADLHGQLVVAFDIGADGAVSGVSETVSTLGNAELSTCIQTAFGQFRFPPPSEGTAHASVALDLRVIPVPNEEHPPEGAAEASTTEAAPAEAPAEAAE